MTKPTAVWCPKCKSAKTMKNGTPSQISHYKDAKLRTFNVWVGKCSTCDSVLQAFDVSPKPVGRNRLCAECGKRIYPDPEFASANGNPVV